MFETTLVATTETDVAPLFPADVDVVIENVDETLSLLENNLQLVDLDDVSVYKTYSCNVHLCLMYVYIYIYILFAHIKH